MKNVLITGATGMVGKGVLLECLDHPEIDQITVLGRNSTGLKHPKLSEIIHADFHEFESISESLKHFDACFFCLGISSAGMKEADYKEITYDITLNLATELRKAKKDLCFIYVSGEGTDRTEKGRTMWARVKGKVENDLIKLGFDQAFMFRPGAIIPLRGIKSNTKLYQFIYDYFLWAVKLFKRIAPNSVVNTTDIGKAMINACLFGYDKDLIKPVDILVLSKKQP